MRYIFLFFLFNILIYACSGDCLQCHPTLEKSIEKNYHVILKKCVNCHTTLPEGMTECGGDCFNCHSQNKLSKTKLQEHQELSSCKNCHVNKEDILNFKEINNESNLLDLMENK
ncbi:MAG: hypothetical protein GY932_09440 [Arcobacter sp.]|nr:hypothetical protein [Arcobacter sp.]